MSSQDYVVDFYLCKAKTTLGRGGGGLNSLISFSQCPIYYLYKYIIGDDLHSFHQYFESHAVKVHVIPHPHPAPPFFNNP